MANAVAKKMINHLAEELTKKTHFKKHECEALLIMFRELTKPSNKMDRTKFRDVLLNTFNHTDDVLMDRIFRTFDTDNDSYVSMKEWVEGLSIFLRGSLDEQKRFCFDVYDMNSDGFISREEMFQLLKTSLVKQPTEEDPDEGIKDLVELTLKKMDHDHDSRLSYDDYDKSVDQEPLLLEVFGECLPSCKAKDAFEAQFCEEAEHVKYKSG